MHEIKHSDIFVTMYYCSEFKGKIPALHSDHVSRNIHSKKEALIQSNQRLDFHSNMLKHF